MKKINNQLSDNELVYLYRECQQVESMKILYERYLEKTSCFCAAILYKNLNLNVIDSNELYFQVNNIIDNVVKKYDYNDINENKRRGSFKKFLNIYARRRMLDEYRNVKFHKSPHHTWMLSYDDLLDKSTRIYRYKQNYSIYLSDTTESPDELANNKQYDKYRIDWINKVLNENFDKKSRNLFLDYFNYGSIKQVADKYKKSVLDTKKEVSRMKKRIKYIINTSSEYSELMWLNN